MQAILSVCFKKDGLSLSFEFFFLVLLETFIVDDRTIYPDTECSTAAGKG
jgi:hypothetical protein